MLALLLTVCFSVTDYERLFMERTADALDQVIGLPPYAQARDLVTAGRVAEGLDVLGQAALDAEDAEVQFGYVMALHELVSAAGTTEAARREFVRVAGEIAPSLEGDPRYALLINQSVHQGHSGDADLATATLEVMTAEISDPANEWYCLARYQQAQVAIGQGDWPGAARYLEELRRLGHHYPDSLQEKTEFQLLNAYASLQKWDAMRELGERLRAKVKDPDRLTNVLYHLGSAYSALNRPREAYEAFNEADQLLGQHSPHVEPLRQFQAGVRIKAKSALALAEAMEAGDIAAKGGGEAAAAVSAEALPAPASPLPLPVSASAVPLPPAEMMKLSEDTGSVPLYVRLLYLLPFTGGIFLLGALAGGGAVFLFMRRRRSAG